MAVIDLFAGPGGWDIGARAAGIHAIGIEHDATACATRAAAQLATIRADLYHYPPQPCEGLIASPPCQTWSSAGGKQRSIGRGSGRLMLTPLEWAQAVKPRWVAIENVPGAFDSMRGIATQLEQDGYRCTITKLRADDYGVPQMRTRAFLFAHYGRPVVLPTPTLSRPATMQELLPHRAGWSLDRRQTGVKPVPSNAIAPTVTSAAVGKGVWVWRRGDEREPVSPVEIAAMQTFPAGHPWQGTRSQIGTQIGNAVPPLLAQRILEAITR